MVVEEKDTMALWQADYFLIPEGTWPQIPKSSRRDFQWWAETPFPSDYETVFLHLFRRSQAWAAEMELYEDDVGNIISVSSENGKVVECYVRFDLRYLRVDDLKEFFNYCRANNLELLDDQNEVVKMDLHSIRQSLRDSKAFRFVSDPHKFLEQLNKEIEDQSSENGRAG